MDELLQIGEIVNTHGVRGDVKVYPYTDDITRFSRLKEVILSDSAGERVVSVKGVKYFKNMVILHIAGTESMNEAERLRGAKLFVDREHAEPLKDNEYYVVDLIGLTVINDDGRTLGILRDVLPTGANDVYEVKGEETCLIPAIKDCILSVDLKERVMRVHLMPTI